MSVIFDNNFTRDSNATRTARLLTIQGNFASIQTELNAPAHIETWSEDCFDIYTDLVAQAGLEANQVEGATAVLVEKEALMDEEYQNVRLIGLTIYKDLPDYLKDYGFEEPYPIKRNDKFKRVGIVIKSNADHIAIGATPLLPAALITRLTNAMNDFQEAENTQFSEMSESRHAYTTASNRFIADTKMLNELKGWWFAMLGKKDERIIQIGMVNPQTGGGAHVLPAPTDLSFYFPSLTFSWSEVPGATSYSLEYSPDGIVDYVEIYSGTDLEFAYTPPIEGTTFYKIRCRSAAGFSQYSPVLAQGYYAGPTLPAPSNLAVELVTGTTDSIKLSFDAVPSANVYKIYRSTTNIGDVAGSFVYAGQSNIPEFIETIAAAGHRFYYRCTAENPHQASGNSSQVWIEIA